MNVLIDTILVSNELDSFGDVDHGRMQLPWTRHGYGRLHESAVKLRFDGIMAWSELSQLFHSDIAERCDTNGLRSTASLRHGAEACQGKKFAHRFGLAGFIESELKASRRTCISLGGVGSPCACLVDLCKHVFGLNSFTGLLLTMEL